jgi:centrosomal CEP192-like protein
LGTFSSSLTIEDNDPSGVQVVNLSGSSFDPFGLSATALKFGSIAVGGTSTAQTVTLTNRQNQPLSILSIATSGDYGQTNTCASSLAAGQSCAVSVVFHPTASATISGALSFFASVGSNQSTPFSIPLSGIGTGSVVRTSRFSLRLSILETWATSPRRYCEDGHGDEHE